LVQLVQKLGLLVQVAQSGPQGWQTAICCLLTKGMVPGGQERMQLPLRRKKVLWQLAHWDWSRQSEQLLTQGMQI
jgi:hypothetical protein